MLEDAQRVGTPVMRELMLDAVQGDDALVRYCDDDDTLLPHRAAVLQAFEDPEVEVVYANHLVSSRVTPGDYFNIALSGNPRRDALRVHPWSWVARLGALRGIQSGCGSVWDPAFPFYEGGFCWMRFLQQRMVIRHLPILAYRYNAGRFQGSVATHPDFDRYARLLSQQIRGIQ